MSLIRWLRPQRLGKLMIVIILMSSVVYLAFTALQSQNHPVSLAHDPASHSEDGGGLFAMMVQSLKHHLQKVVRGGGATRYSPPCNAASRDCYRQTLSSRADSDRVLLLAMTDSSYAEMALNFYLTSIKRLHINNYLFLGADMAACSMLASVGAACFVYDNKTKVSLSSNYGSPAFNRKVNARSVMILQALQMNFTVLSSDVDILILQNPFPYFNCTTCDMEVSWDAIEFNSGFLLARPTKMSRALYGSVISIMDNNPHFHDQNALNIALQRFGAKRTRASIRRLPDKLFLNGLQYFEKGQRFFAGSSERCPSCVAVHNNWIVTKEAKIYRFKENHMWFIDTNGYYTNPHRKYLIYENPHLNAFATSAHRLVQKAALSNALKISMILNRTLILPTFQCPKVLCPLNSYFRVDSMDAMFGDNYREHTFLTHPLVPRSVKSSLSKIVFIKTSTSSRFHTMPSSSSSAAAAESSSYSERNVIETFTPANQATGATSREIRNWFGSRTDAVLRFHSMFGVFGGFESQDANLSINMNKRLEKGLVYSTYRQYLPKQLVQHKVIKAQRRHVPASPVNTRPSNPDN